MKRLSIFAVLIFLCTPAIGQEISFQQLISGNDMPYTMKLSEMTSVWRHMVITAPGGQNTMGDMMSQIMQAGMMSEASKNKTKEDPMSAALGMQFLSGLLGGGGTTGGQVYFTRGQTITIGSETFLVTYHWEKPQMNMMQMMMQGDKNKPDTAAMAQNQKMNENSELSLILINVKSIGTLSGLRPFDMKKEIEESANGGGSMMDMMMQQMQQPDTNEKPTPVNPAPRVKKSM